jgi:hypothetical protein
VGGAVEPVVRPEQIPLMFVVYGLGFSAVFAIFALLYLHAYRKRRALELSELESFDTRAWFQENALMALVGLLSVCIALTRNPRYVFFAGMVYWLIAPILFINGSMMGKRRRRLEQRAAEKEGVGLNVSTH